MVVCSFFRFRQHFPNCVFNLFVFLLSSVMKSIDVASLTRWQTFDEFRKKKEKKTQFFPNPSIAENWVQAYCDCRTFYKQFILIGIALGMKWTTAPLEGEEYYSTWSQTKERTRHQQRQKSRIKNNMQSTCKPTKKIKYDQIKWIYVCFKMNYLDAKRINNISLNEINQLIIYHVYYHWYNFYGSMDTDTSFNWYSFVKKNDNKRIWDVRSLLTPI